MTVSRYPFVRQQLLPPLVKSPETPFHRSTDSVCWAVGVEAAVPPLDLDCAYHDRCLASWEWRLVRISRRARGRRFLGLAVTSFPLRACAVLRGRSSRVNSSLNAHCYSSKIRRLKGTWETLDTDVGESELQGGTKQSNVAACVASGQHSTVKLPLPQGHL
jgi:hypothetical protein